MKYSAVKSGWAPPGKAHGFIRLFLAVLIVGGLVSCSSSSGVKTPSGVQKTDFTGITRIAVIDFFEGRHPQRPGTAHVDHITGFVLIPGKIISGSGELVANQFRYRLRRQGFSVVQRSSVDDIFSLLDSAALAGRGVELGVAAGNKLDVDAVIMGTVMRFEEREGTKLGSAKPAAVSLSVAMIASPENKVVWKAKFEKTQKALLSNVLDFRTFFKGKMVWQKAHTLSGIGVENILEQMPVANAGR